MRNNFTPGWKMSLFTLFFLPVLLSLGKWQLDRASFKQDLEFEYLASMVSLPVNLSDFEEKAFGEFENFTKIRAEGRYIDQLFYLDNQTTNGQVGYWVFQPFLTNRSRQNFIVNRGFIPAPILRGELPHVETPSGIQIIEVTAWPYTGLPPIFGDDDWGNNWPKRIQSKDLMRMGKVSGSYAQELRIEANAPGALQALPNLEQFDDSKHLGYALTWFGLAATLCVSFLIFGFNGKSRTQEDPR